MELYMRRNFKQIIFYFGWGLLLLVSTFRYQIWHVFEKQTYCFEDRLLAYAQAGLKPENWLAIAALIFTVVASLRLYGLVNDKWLWFSHYGRFIVITMIFIGLWLLSRSCNGL